MPQHDAKKIRYVGTDQLPVIAGHVQEAKSSLNETSGDWEPAFRSSEMVIVDIGIGEVTAPAMYAESLAGWSAAASALVELLGESRARIEEAAQVMIAVADNYDRAEAQGAQSLRDVQNRLEQIGTGER